MTQIMPSGNRPPAERFDQAHEALLRDRTIQFDATAFQPPEVPDWLEGLLRILGSPTFRVIFWVVLGLVALALAAIILNRFWGVPLPWRRRAAHAPADEPIWQSEAAPARALLHEADALAVQGRFDEAAHLLLFRSIEDIEARRPHLVKPALTSRDIAAAPQIPSSARTSFGAIVAIVERSLFGGRKLGEEEWRDCRSAYETFAFGKAWQA